MVLAFVGAILIGLSLGVMGSGGSILTVPALTYLVGQDEKLAIAGSLAITGAIAFIAGLPHVKQKSVDYRSLVFFGLAGMAGSYVGASLSQFVSGAVQLVVFSVLMFAAGVLMLRPVAAEGSEPRTPRPVPKIMLDGVCVGIVTGFVGVGGGFAIVPALVLLGGLPMRRAVGTSLFIIAMQSSSGFYKHLDLLAEQGLKLDWEIIGIFIGLGAIGSLVGNKLGGKLPQAMLRRGFAIFLFLIGTFIVAKTLPGLL